VKYKTHKLGNKQVNVYPKHVRAEVTALLAAGASYDEVGERFSVPRTTMYYWKHEGRRLAKKKTPPTPDAQLQMVVREKINAKQQEELPQATQAYAVGYTTCFLTHYAAQHGLSVRTLTDRVAALLKAG
jgi:transposase